MSNEQRGVVFARVHVQQHEWVYARIRTRYDALSHAGVPDVWRGVLGAPPDTLQNIYEKYEKS